MRAAIIIDNTITNIVEATSLTSAKALFGDAVDASTLPAGAAIGWLKTGPQWAAPEIVPEQPVVSQPVLYASTELAILDGDVSMGVNARFAGAFWGDVGKYYVFFAEPQPDTAYIALADGGPARAYILPSEKAEDYFIITVIDQAGQPIDAEVVNITIVRAF